MGTVTANASEVFVVELDGAITPATARYFIRSLDDAQEAGAAALVVQLDTPGGLDEAMRDMIKAILASRVPVVVYVAPNGSRAASAGTYLLYASHVAAMAPATNVGSSTPVSIGGSPFPQGEPPAEGDGDAREPGPSAMERKIVNDAVAYIRGLATLRGRNADWAEMTVREAANLTAAEALEMNVIDLVAEDLDALLMALDGRAVDVAGATVTLDLEGAEIERIVPDWRDELLALITNPNVAYILLMLGIYGLILEFYNPGTGVPGVTGVICLLLAAYALQMLPVSYAGLALLLFGVALMVAEIVTPTVGVLGVGGVIAFVAGSIILFDSDLPGYRVSIPIIAAAAVASAAVFLIGIGSAMRARRLRVATGREAMIGARAVALEDFAKRGNVRAFSENWLAESPHPVRKGDELRVTGVEGLVLRVEPTTQEHVAEES
ncbi:MAG TPA: nodulation protein NfeD [Gammaproteobacteria bacterium]|nr:nodulation protein NfeD [Gammaproteobacteria bacterium]